METFTINQIRPQTLPAKPEKHGALLTCTVEDEDFTGSDTIILTVEDEPMTTTETARKPSTISPIYTVPLKEVETVMQEFFEIIKQYIAVDFFISILILFLCVLGLFIKEKIH
ncbi:uncharacterized protein [Antedon mediterranea]|uniref:uncharacterized protein n=1 Tax=Antedon mediterranea TaxID=105859 RepID=UPI003AF8ED96